MDSIIKSIIELNFMVNVRRYVRMYVRCIISSLGMKFKKQKYPFQNTLLLHTYVRIVHLTKNGENIHMTLLSVYYSFYC